MEETEETEVKKPKYQNVPLDAESYKILEGLCAHYGLSRRSKGSFVGRLLKEEKRKLETLQAMVSGSEQAAQ